MATGRKTVVVGQVIDPVTWGNPLWDQSVQTFTSAADRTAQFPAPKQGAVTWLEDVKRLEVYNGTTWARVSGAVEHISVTAATDASGVLTVNHTLGVTPANVIWNFVNGMDQPTFLVMNPVLVWTFGPTQVQLRFSRNDTHAFIVTAPIKGILTVLA